MRKLPEIKSFSLAVGLAALAMLAVSGRSATDGGVQAILPPPTPAGFTGTTVEPAATPVPVNNAVQPTPRPLVSSTGEGEWHANCEAFTIDVTKTYIGESRCYVADIVVGDMAALRTACAYDTFENERKGPSFETAQRHNAVLAVNGNYYC